MYRNRDSRLLQNLPSFSACTHPHSLRDTHSGALPAHHLDSISRIGKGEKSFRLGRGSELNTGHKTHHTVGSPLPTDVKAAAIHSGLHWDSESILFAAAWSHQRRLASQFDTVMSLENKLDNSCRWFNSEGNKDGDRFARTGRLGHGSAGTLQD